MEKVKLEVVLDDPVDREYYGYLYLTTIITMKNPQGNIKKIINKIDADLYEFKIIYNEQAKNVQKLADLNKQFSALKLVTQQHKRNLTVAKKALAKVDPVKARELKDETIKSNEIKLGKLDKELNELATYTDTNKLNTSNTFYRVITSLLNKNWKLENIDIHTFINTVIGSTYLYKVLLQNGWKLIDPYTDSLNNIMESEDVDGDELIFTSCESTDEVWKGNNCAE